MSEHLPRSVRIAAGVGLVAGIGTLAFSAYKIVDADVQTGKHLNAVVESRTINTARDEAKAALTSQSDANFFSVLGMSSLGISFMSGLMLASKRQ